MSIYAHLRTDASLDLMIQGKRTYGSPLEKQLSCKLSGKKKNRPLKPRMNSTLLRPPEGINVPPEVPGSWVGGRLRRTHCRRTVCVHQTPGTKNIDGTICSVVTLTFISWHSLKTIFMTLFKKSFLWENIGCTMHVHNLLWMCINKTRGSITDPHIDVGWWRRGLLQ